MLDFVGTSGSGICLLVEDFFLPPKRDVQGFTKFAVFNSFSLFAPFGCLDVFAGGVQIGHTNPLVSLSGRQVTNLDLATDSTCEFLGLGSIGVSDVHVDDFTVAQEVLW